jgi:hypothetical protein
MRVWDIPVKYLCNKHLVAQHHEIHCIATIVDKKYHRQKVGFANHPEVLRWYNNKVKTLSLVKIHDEAVAEMKHRGMKHNDRDYSAIIHTWLHGTEPIPMPKPWQPVEQQVELLKAKGCGCRVDDYMADREVNDGSKMS